MTMDSKQLVFLLVGLCGLLLKTVHCNMEEMNPGTPSGPVGGDDILTDNFEETDDVMTRLNSVQTMEDFLALLESNGHSLSLNDSLITSPHVDENGKLVISGGGRLAVPDNCSPRNITVRISVQGTDSETAYFPRCTRIERCGGCTTSPNLECVPRYTERVILKVLKGRMPYPGATHLEYNGFESVIVERHLACRIQCSLSQDLCGRKKTFNSRKCICQCNNITACAAPTVWDPEECECKCPQITQCCANGENCGMTFNHHLCECQLQNSGQMSISMNNNRNSPIRRPTTTTTEATTTTTQGTTTPSDPCANHTCPNRFTKSVREGRCVCSPPTNTRRRNRNRTRTRTG